MKIKILLIAILFSCFSWGQIASWDFFGEGSTSNPTSTADIYNAGLDASNLLTRGSSAGYSAGADSFRTVGFSNNGIATSNNDYFQFTLSSTPGNNLSLSTIDARLAGTASFATSPGVSSQFAYSLDGITFVLISSAQVTVGQPISLTQISLTSISALQNIPDTTTVTFRYYASGQTTTGGWGFKSGTTAGTNGLAIGGTINSSGPLQTITTDTVISGSPFCVSASTGVPVNLPYTISGSFTSGNVFTAQLSNASGIFTTPVNIGTLTSTMAGTISATIPAGTLSGTGYRIRVVSNTPSITGSDNTVNLTVNLTNVSIAPTAIQNIGVATNGTTLAVTENPVAISRQWFYSNVSGGPNTNAIASATTSTYVPNFATASTYFVVCVTTSACGTITSNQVQINVTLPSPEINIKGVIASNPSIPDGTVAVSGLNNTLFTSVLVGSNQAKVFRIENTGALPLTVSSILLVGANVGDFAFSGVAFPLVIASGTFQDFTVTFSPTAVGTRTATINIISDDADEANYDFNLQGNGITTTLVDINVKGNAVSIPDNSLFPTGLNFTAFGVAIVGSTTVTRVFTIENLGTTDLTLTGVPFVTISGFNASSFSVSLQPLSNTIAGGSSLTFSILFNPTTLGSKNATINILSNDGDETLYNFNINGTAKGANNIYLTGNNNSVFKGSTTTSISNNTNFGSVSITGGIKQNAFLITNLSTSSVTFNSIVITGPNASLFTVVTQPGINPVGSGLSTSFLINFAPTTLGIKNATATFTSDDPTDPTFSFAISGIGEDYIPCTFGAIQTIVIQDFEDVPATPTWLYTNVSDGTLNIAGGNFSIPTSVPGFIDIKALQFSGISSTATVSTNVISLNAVDTSQFTNINMSMKVAAIRTGSTQGLDIGDFIQIETSIDNGVNWSAEAKLAGYDNSRWSFAATGIYNAYYSGTNNGASVDTRLGNGDLTPTGGISTYNLKNLPTSSNLLIRITMVSDRISEIWAIDNIKIEGQIPVSSTWDGVSWLPVAPTTSTKAIIDGTYNTGINGNITACECQIKSGKTLNINNGLAVPSNPSVEIQSNIFNDGIINIDNNSSLIQVNNSAQNGGSGVTNVIRDTTPYQKYDYTYWSSPIQNNTIGSSFSAWRQNFSFEYNTTKFSDLFSGVGFPQIIAGSDTFDDNDDDWVPVTQATAMIPGRGYAIMENQATHPATTSVLFSGAPNNGLVTASLKFSANAADTTDDLNFVGNPYPSAISANDFINANLPNISGTLYFWTHKDDVNTINPGPDLYNFTNDDYAYYNLTGGIATNATVGTGSNTGSNAPTGFIASGQGFFVEAQNEVDLIFSNSMRAKTYSNTNFFRNANLNNNQIDRLWLNLTNTDGTFSQQLIGYFDNATLENDQAYDAQMLKGPSNINFYSQSQSQFYKIQARPTFNSNDTVLLGFTSTANSNFSISIDSKEGVFDTQNIYLQDNLLNIVHDLKQAPYNFASTYGTFDDRFVLRYENSVLSNNTFVNEENQVIISAKDTKINIVSNTQKIKQIEVFDVLGRRLFNNDLVNEKTFTTTSILAKNQTLIVKIKLENGEIITRKIII